MDSMRQMGKGNRRLTNANPLSADPTIPPRSDRTDFKGLVPGQYARHPGRSSEREAMAEGHGVTYHSQSRPGRLGRPEGLRGLQARDVRAAAAALVKKGQR